MLNYLTIGFEIKDYYVVNHAKASGLIRAFRQIGSNSLRPGPSVGIPFKSGSATRMASSMGFAVSGSTAKI